MSRFERPSGQCNEAPAHKSRGPLHLFTPGRIQIGAEPAEQRAVLDATFDNCPDLSPSRRSCVDPFTCTRRSSGDVDAGPVGLCPRCRTETGKIRWITRWVAAPHCRPDDLLGVCAASSCKCRNEHNHSRNQHDACAHPPKPAKQRPVAVLAHHVGPAG